MDRCALRQVPGLLVLGIGIAVVLVAIVHMGMAVATPTHQFSISEGQDIKQHSYHFENLSPQAQTITAQTVTSGHLVTSHKPPAYTDNGTYYIRLNGSYREIRFVQSGTRAVPNETRRQPVYTYTLLAGEQADSSEFADQFATATPVADRNDQTGDNDSSDQSATITPVPEVSDTVGVYDFSDLTDREQRIIQQALNNTDGTAGARTSGEHFRVIEDSGSVGHGTYYIHVGDQYYRLAVSKTGTDAVLTLGIWFIVLCIGGGGTLSALISLRQTPSAIAGPSALLSGSAIVAASFITAPYGETINGELVPWAVVVAILVYGGSILRRRLAI